MDATLEIVVYAFFVSLIEDSSIVQSRNVKKHKQVVLLQSQALKNLNSPSKPPSKSPSKLPSKYPSKFPSKSSLDIPLNSHVLNIKCHPKCHPECHPECHPHCHLECWDRWNMVRSHTVMVWSNLEPKKSLVKVNGGWVGTRPNLVYSSGQDLWALSRTCWTWTDLTWLDLTWPDLDLTLTWTWAWQHNGITQYKH